MPLLSYIINKFIWLANFLLNAYIIMIIGRVVISWVNADLYNPIVRFIYDATEPVLGFVRRKIPLVFAGIDFSPVLLILAITMVQDLLVWCSGWVAFNLG